MTSDPVLERLRSVVRSDMRPVRPLRPAWQRAPALLAVAVVLLLLVPLAAGLRQDSGRLGILALWGSSIVQFMAAYGLFAAALTTVIPGAGRPLTFFGAASAAALMIHLAVASLTYFRSPVYPDVGEEWRLRAICFAVTTLIGLAPLAMALVLAARGLFLRPVLLGFLSGISAGLVAEAAWRTHCAYSSPGHVLASHTTGILAVGVAGSLVTWALSRRQPGGRQLQNTR